MRLLELWHNHANIDYTDFSYVGKLWNYESYSSEHSLKQKFEKLPKIFQFLQRFRGCHEREYLCPWKNLSLIGYSEAQSAVDVL